MTNEQIFSLASTIALVGWVIIVIAPRWQHARTLAFSGVVLLLSTLYAYLIIRYMGGAVQNGGGFGSLREVTLLFQMPEALLAGWVHYLAFDLFLGTWEAEDGKRNGIHRLVLVPIHGLTFYYGPVGLVLYFLVRGFQTRRVGF